MKQNYWLALFKGIRKLDFTRATVKQVSHLTVPFFKYHSLNQRALHKNGVRSLSSAWVYFCSYRTSRRSNWQRLLGTLLLGTWDSAGWTNAQWQNYRWRRRLVQYFLQRDGSWKARPSSGDGRLGANGSWYVQKISLLFFWCPLMFKMYPCVLLWFCLLLVLRSHGRTSLLTDLHTIFFFFFVRFVLFNFVLTCVVVSLTKLKTINFNGNSSIPW